MSVFREDLTAMLPKLRAYARSLCAGDTHLADDVVQDALVRALRAQHRFEPGTNLEAWMFTILRNVFLNTVRRRPPTTALEPNAWENLVAVAPDQEKRLEWRAFERAFAQLSPTHREVLVLAVVDGLDYEAIAERTGCRVGTVKSRVNRARERLHNLLLGPDEAVRTEASERSTSPQRVGAAVSARAQ